MISDRIKILRLENNLTQKELAEKIQTSNKNIWAYENNISTPPAETLIKIADFFDVSLDYLLGREDDDYIQPSIVYHGQTNTPIILTKEEESLIYRYRSLTPALQQMLQETINTWEKSNINKKGEIIWKIKIIPPKDTQHT